LRHTLSNLISLVGISETVAERDTAETLATIAKTAPLLVRNGAGLCTAAVLFGLDQARRGDSLLTQVSDFGLGATKGALTAKVSSIVLSGVGGPAFQGVMLGVTTRALDVVLTRQTFLDQENNFDVGGAYNRIKAVTFGA